MTDVHSKETRSYNMSRIKSKNTKPELLVRKFLHKNGFRYRLHSSSLPGKPDIILPKYKTVVLVHGCFWHAHQTCGSYLKPKSNTEFWNQKFESNVSRDQKNIDALAAMNWKTIVIWECELKTKCRADTLNNLKSKILSNE